MEGPLLLDDGVFDEIYVPEKLVAREGQIKEIARSLSPAKNGKAIRNLFIHGPPGVGKTLVCKWILNEHFPKQFVYINCWSKRTSHKVMEQIVQKLGRMVNGRESTSELISKFEQVSKKLIVCLDEADHLDDMDILYILARNSCGIILISNDSGTIARMDPRVRSSLLLNEVEFKQYTHDEVYEILKERANYGLQPGAYDNAALLAIAKMSAGDARIALQTLRAAAKDAETKSMETITLEEIKNAIKFARKYRLSYLLGKLNEHQRTIYELLKKNGRMESGKLFLEYCKVTDDHVVDRGYRNHMRRMEELGLVKSEGSGRWKKYQVVM